MKNVNTKNIIVVGASAGGLSAVSRLLSKFNIEMDVSVFVVIHVSRYSSVDIILNHIQRQTKLKCKIPEDGEYIESKTVYFPKADHHLMIEKDRVFLQKGAYENHWRPSIDVLFRSAAAAYDSCVTGIILTGLLDDGTSGMYAIKRCGGTCIVQDPEEAEFADMPKSVIRNMEVDYQFSVDEMGDFISQHYSDKECVPGIVPEEVKYEAEIAKRIISTPNELQQLGDFTPFTCPDCGGSMVKVNGDVVGRYRCYTGHTFTERSLVNEQVKRIEESLWVAIRMMEERRNLLITLSGDDDEDNKKDSRANQLETHVERLKNMMKTIGHNA